MQLRKLEGEEQENHSNNAGTPPGLPLGTQGPVPGEVWWQVRACQSLITISFPECCLGVEGTLSDVAMTPAASSKHLQKVPAWKGQRAVLDSMGNITSGNVGFPEGV